MGWVAYSMLCSGLCKYHPNDHAIDHINEEHFAYKWHLAGECRWLFGFYSTRATMALPVNTIRHLLCYITLCCIYDYRMLWLCISIVNAVGHGSKDFLYPYLYLYGSKIMLKIRKICHTTGQITRCPVDINGNNRKCIMSNSNLTKWPGNEFSKW